MKEESCLLEVIRSHEGEIVEDWLKQYHEASGASPDSLAGSARELLGALAHALAQSGSVDIRSGDWADTRRIQRMHSDPAVGNGNPASTARLMLALKYVLFARTSTRRAASPTRCGARRCCSTRLPCSRSISDACRGWARPAVAS